MRIRDIKTERGLSPSGLNMSDYVVNPYRGCAFGCLYCYAKKNKVAERTAEAWGEFVDVKTNLPDLVERDLRNKQPQRILIGSITDPYQPVELEYQLTRRVLESCVQHQVQVTILTRSPHIVRDLDLLHNIPGLRIYFTVNWPNEQQLRIFEKRSFNFADRLEAIRSLRSAGLEVVPNVSPLFPGLFDISVYFEQLAPLADRISFENFNQKVVPLQLVQDILANNFNGQAALFQKVYATADEYARYWDGVKEEILDINKKYGKKVEFLFHGFDSYFGRD
jgi:DNA repair photolyase